MATTCPGTISCRTSNVSYSRTTADNSPSRNLRRLYTHDSTMETPPARRISTAGRRRMSTAGRRSVSMTRQAARRLSTHHFSHYQEPNNTPNYLYRTPTHQMRIGLRSDRLAPGTPLTGTVVIYRDTTAGERVPAIDSVTVTLHCEVARRKTNTSYRPGQQFSPQDIAPQAITRYEYTRTLVPHSQKWHSGPWEAPFHHDAAPFRTAVNADLAPMTSHGRVQCHPFSVVVPNDAPPSRTWNDNKQNTFVDIRYRIVAVAKLARPDSVLLAEAVVIVSPSLSNVPCTQSNYGVPSVTARSKTTLSRRALTLIVEKRSISIGDDNTLAKVNIRSSKNTHAKLYILEHVMYSGKLRTTRRVSCKRTNESQWRVPTRGLCEDIMLGPLSVSHEVCAIADDLVATVRIRLTRGNRHGVDEVLASTRTLRRQPPIYYYFEDELPLFSNLEYRAARAGGAPNGRLCAAALAARLPRLTHMTGTEDEDVCCLCLEDLADGMVTRLAPCGHVMHLECAKKWLRHAAREWRATVCCPMCKSVLE